MHTKQEESDAFLSGIRQVMWGDEVQVRTQTKLQKPFKITATNRDTDPIGVVSKAMIKAGYAKPGERLSGPEVTRRLKAAGFDGVELDQVGGYNHDLAGSQQVVFDPKDVRLRPETRLRLQRTKRGLVVGKSHKNRG